MKSNPSDFARAMKILKPIIKHFFGLGIFLSFNSSWHKSSGRRLILNLHRVHDNDGSSWAPIPERVFEDALQLIEKYYVITDLNDETKYSKPSATLSFDDGFYDFYTNVLPIIHERKLTVNQNVIPRCIELGLPPLNVTIQDFAGRTEEKMLRRIDWGFHIPEHVRAREFLAQWSQELKKKPFKEQLEIEEFLLPQINEIESFNSTRIMSIKELKDAASITHFGNHSFSHAYMANETMEFFVEDFTNSQNWFEKNLGLRPETYAFPNGASTHESIDFLKMFEIRHILLVGNRSSVTNSNVKQRVNFSPQGLTEAKFDINRPLLGALI